MKYIKEISKLKTVGEWKTVIMKKNEWTREGLDEWINEGIPTENIEIEKCIERTKKKLFNIITEYNIEHVDDYEKTSAYRLADNLYRKYKSFEKKDGLTLHEIKVLNKFYE